VVQVAEHLPSKYKALNSNPSERQTVGGPCVPKRWQLARGEMPLLLPKKHLFMPERYLFMPKSLPSGNKKSCKTWFATWPRGLPVSGSCSMTPCGLSFPSPPLLIKLFWPLLLKSASDFYSSGTMDPHHPAPQPWWPWRDTSSLEVGTGCAKLERTA
jgi:hypothetical protein